MAGEPILIVDDTPVNLKLTRILLVNEGYKVMTAASAEEALELLRSYHPFLVLADIQLPGIDGLELTRRIKQEEKTRDISVVALTAFAMKGDEQRAIDAGCDGYITKPIDTRALGAKIREFLGRRAEVESGPVPPPADSEHASIPAAELHALRRRFLEEGQGQARQWLLDLEGTFDPNSAARVVHQWIGAAGLLGFTALSRLSREVEAILHERPVDQTQLRDSLTTLTLAFSSPKDARDAPISAGIVQALSGKSIALVGLPANEARRFEIALERAEATSTLFQHFEKPDPAALKGCQAVVIHITPETSDSPWLDEGSPVAGAPILLVGARDHLLALSPRAQNLAREFLMDAWQPEEALVRLSHALSDQRPANGPRLPAAPMLDGKTRVVIADDDPTVLTLVRSALQNFGLECETANNGRAALELIRKNPPQAAVLDVNMPGMDGYEVLGAIRADGLPMKVLLLTARQQEGDVIRGFSLGADDYVVKPFGPMELVARLKRLLSR
jgi:two-component system cell cycle response regulator DivK